MGLGFPPPTGRINMRGLILLLPALLVLLLAGTARTEKETSSVADADLPSNLLPLSEKVGVREARGTGKRDGEGENKKQERAKIRKAERKKKMKSDERKRRRKIVKGSKK